MNEFIWILPHVGGGDGVHDQNVVDTVLPLLQEVLDDKVTLLLRVLWYLLWTVGCCITNQWGF